jgi:glycosyltransferase involved in cell wall biosynthesis
MKLSFVIPAYNEEKYISQCLLAIFREMAGKNLDVEIIVVNNASTDRTREVAEKFSGVRVVDEPNKGLTKARNAGYQASSGELIANIDADTMLPPGWMEKVFQEFANDSELVALSGPYVYYDLSPLAKNIIRVWYGLYFAYHFVNHKIFKNTAVLQGGNFILRRSALQKIGGYRLEFDFYGEDTDIATRIQKVGKVKFTRQLPMYTSGRRLKKEGLLITGWRYAINHFWTLFFKKPLTKKFEDVRK